MTYQFKREPLTREEADRIVNACRTAKEKLVVWTLLDTGLRVGELATLKPDNIQWQEGRLMVYGKGGPYGSKTKRRIVPMSERVKKLLEAHFALQNEIGMSTPTMRRMVKRVANRAGISRPCSPHVLRHTFAVLTLQKGISLPTLQKILGHDRLETTAIYLNVSPEEAIREFKEKW